MRRSHNAVLTDVLKAIVERPDARPTAIATHANVPYDRLVHYLDELARLRLIRPDASHGPTPEGLQLLAERERWIHALRRAGLEDPDRE